MNPDIFESESHVCNPSSDQYPAGITSDELSDKNSSLIEDNVVDVSLANDGQQTPIQCNPVTELLDGIIHNVVQISSSKSDVQELGGNPVLETAEVNDSEIVRNIVHPRVKSEVDRNGIQNYRDFSEDSSSDSESISTASSSDYMESEIVEEKVTKIIPRTKGEILIEDLPPIQELQITVDENALLKKLGFVSAIVNTLVVIQSYPETPALNLDSVLFTEDRQVFGQVFEILGPVVTPYYTVRFNKEDDIVQKGIAVGYHVYFAPQIADCTNFVFLEQLRQMRGSDASWEDNNEPPEKYLDFSDDEEERRFKARLRGKNRKPRNTENSNDVKNFKQSKKQNSSRQQHQHNGLTTDPHQVSPSYPRPNQFNPGPRNPWSTRPRHVYRPPPPQQWNVTGRPEHRQTFQNNPVPQQYPFMMHRPPVSDPYAFHNMGTVNSFPTGNYGPPMYPGSQYPPPWSHNGQQRPAFQHHGQFTGAPPMQQQQFVPGTTYSSLQENNSQASVVDRRFIRNNNH